MEDTGSEHPMFYRCHLKEHARDGLAAMNCNRRQNTKTINKQIGFLEARSVPDSPGLILVDAEGHFCSSEIRLAHLIYSC